LWHKKDLPTRQWGMTVRHCFLFIPVRFQNLFNFNKGGKSMIEDWYQEKDKENRYPKELVMGEFLRRNADRFPDRTAVVYGDRRYTYREFNTRVNRLANALLTLGLKKGQRVGIFAHNSDRCVEAALAVAKIGCVFIPVNFRLVGHEVEYILNFSERRPSSWTGPS
jgi:non-ribosomal peptide synthetase component E (peptide arylation enzyme)